jgi:hypothetical protein
MKGTRHQEGYLYRKGSLWLLDTTTPNLMGMDRYDESRKRKN